MVCAVCLGGLAGCSSIQELPAEQALPEKATPEMKLCRQLLHEFLNNHPQDFVQLLPEDMRDRFDEKKFAETRLYITETLGEPVSFQYLTTLEFVTLAPHIWKIRFRRQDKRGNTLHSEALFRIITGRTAQNEVAVIGFNFL